MTLCIRRIGNTLRNRAARMRQQHSPHQFHYTTTAAAAAPNASRPVATRPTLVENRPLPPEVVSVCSLSPLAVGAMLALTVSLEGTGVGAVVKLPLQVQSSSHESVGSQKHSRYAYVTGSPTQSLPDASL